MSLPECLLLAACYLAYIGTTTTTTIMPLAPTPLTHTSLIHHTQVSLPECLLLAAYYLAYMGTTIWMSRGQEPVHADPRLHEVPHRLRPMDSFFKGGWRTAVDFLGAGAIGGRYICCCQSARSKCTSASIMRHSM